MGIEGYDKVIRQHYAFLVREWEQATGAKKLFVDQLLRSFVTSIGENISEDYDLIKEDKEG